MTRIRVGSAAEFESGGRKVLRVGNTEIAVFHHVERIYAIENYCLHQGGPVGEGTLIGRVIAHVNDGGELKGESFSEEEMHIVCPWHGWEYNIATGEHAGDRTLKLRTFEVEKEDGDVYVIV